MKKFRYKNEEIYRLQLALVTISHDNKLYENVLKIV